MSAQTRAVLKSYFEADDYPSEAEFIDLIDSMYNIEDDGGGNLIWNVNGDWHYTLHPSDQDLLRIGIGTSTPDSVIQALNTSNVPYLNIGTANDVAGSFGTVIFGNTNELASSENSIVVGNTNTMNGVVRSMAVGNSNTLTGNTQYAFGDTNIITSSGYASIIGTNNTVSATAYAYVFGQNNTMSGSGYDFIVGHSNNISGTRNYVLGDNSILSGNVSMAFGDSITITHDQASVLSNISTAVSSEGNSSFAFHSNLFLLRLTASTGRMNITNLPTSSAGLVSGDVWNDGGTLKII